MGLRLLYACCVVRSQFILDCRSNSSVFLHKVAVFVILGFALHLHVDYSESSFLSWFIVLIFVCGFIVICFKNGYGPFGTIIEPWASGGIHFRLHFVLLMYCRFFWVDHPLWVAALLSLLLRCVRS